MQHSNRRIARNTLFLYLRMGFSLGVKLYTSRVVLQALGVMDYGLWSVVGGVVTMIEVLNASMAGCTHRFIAYELGHGQREGQQQVFSAALTLHLIIATLVLLMAETVGLWFVETQLSIPPGRMMACRVVYQLSVLSTLVGITQVPYNASIMAHERMDVFAYIDVAHILLRLAVVCLTVALPFDRLIALSALHTLLAVTVLMGYRLYCIRRLPACHFRLSRDWGRLRPMLTFSAWDLYGSASVVLRTQGVAMLLNVSFTAVLNAASGVATSLQSAVMAFANNVVTAFRPQIVMSYAVGEHARMTSLIQRAWTYTSVLLLLLMLPLGIEMDYVLGLWLVNAPAWSAHFARLILLCNYWGNAIAIVNIGIHATGHIRQLSFVNGTLYLLVLPFTWVAFRLGSSPAFPYIYNVGASLLGLGLNVGLLHRLVPAFSRRQGARILGLLTVVAVCAGGLGTVPTLCLAPSLLRLLLVAALTTVTTVGMSWFAVFSQHDRQVIVSEVRRRVGR